MPKAIRKQTTTQQSRLPFTKSKKRKLVNNDEKGKKAESPIIVSQSDEKQTQSQNTKNEESSQQESVTINKDNVEDSQNTIPQDESTVRILRAFDLTYKYGPTIGMTRMERWKRADKLGLKPPENIKTILETQQSKSESLYKDHLWINEEL